MATGYHSKVYIVYIISNNLIKPQVAMTTVLFIAGVIKFHSISLSELETDHEHSDTVSMLSFSNTSILDHCIGQVRETIGVETHMTGSSASNR